MAEPLQHLARRSDWEAAVASAGREYRVSTLGATLDDVGYIHLCRPRQVAGVASRFYVGVDDLVLLDVDPSLVRAPVVDEAVGTDHFPHLYGPLPVDAVTAVRPFAP